MLEGPHESAIVSHSNHSLNPLLVCFQLVSFKLIKAIFGDKSDVKLLIIDFEANQLA